MIDLQIAENLSPGRFRIPEKNQLERWARESLRQNKIEDSGSISETAEISIRIVDEEESGKLNQQYREKSGATNVLSFPAELPDYIEDALLGDLVICAPLVEREAKEQKKEIDDHWAHLVVHGVLHLLGYDHVEEKDAELMESIEIDILENLNIANPY